MIMVLSQRSHSSAGGLAGRGTGGGAARPARATGGTGLAVAAGPDLRAAVYGFVSAGERLPLSGCRRDNRRTSWHGTHLRHWELGSWQAQW